jgi:hypothetical protein
MAESMAEEHRAHTIAEERKREWRSLVYRMEVALLRKRSLVHRLEVAHLRKKKRNHESTDNGSGGSSAHSLTDPIDEEDHSRSSKNESRTQTQGGGERPELTGHLLHPAKPQQQEGRGAQGEQEREQRQQKEFWQLEQAHRGQERLSDLEAWTQRVRELEERVAQRVAARWQTANEEDKQRMEGFRRCSLNQNAIVNCLAKMAMFSQEVENETEGGLGFDLLKKSVQNILIVLEEWTKEAVKMNVYPHMCQAAIQAKALLQAINNDFNRGVSRPRAEDKPPLSEVIKTVMDLIRLHR